MIDKLQKSFGHYPLGSKSCIIGLVLLIQLGVGCSDRHSEAQEANAAAEAKAQANAARKEMEALPKAFKSRDFFKKNETEQTPGSSTQKPAANR